MGTPPLTPPSFSRKGPSISRVLAATLRREARTILHPKRVGSFSRVAHSKSHSAIPNRPYRAPTPPPDQLSSRPSQPFSRHVHVHVHVGSPHLRCSSSLKELAQGIRLPSRFHEGVLEQVLGRRSSRTYVSYDEDSQGLFRGKVINFSCALQGRRKNTQTAPVDSAGQGGAGGKKTRQQDIAYNKKQKHNIR